VQSEKSKDTDQSSKQTLKVRSYYFALKTIKLLDSLPKDYVTQTLGKQLIRSATSIGANILEAQAGASRRDFSNFLSHALKSSNETKFWLGLLRDTRENKEEVKALLLESNEISNMLGASLLTLRGKRAQ
jgi:four helix bundle protein